MLLAEGVDYDFFFFFFSSRRRHTRLVSDWSSDVCSSDLIALACQISPIQSLQSRRISKRYKQISRLSRSLNPAQSAGYGAQILDQVDAGASEYSCSHSLRSSARSASVADAAVRARRPAAAHVGCQQAFSLADRGRLPRPRL